MNENSTTLTFVNRTATILNGLAALVVVLSAIGAAVVYVSGLWDNYVERLSPIPEESIVAFDSSECPEGWVRYYAAAGRVVVGVGSHTENDPWGNPVTKFSLRDKGGHRVHALRSEEMPNHHHALVNQPATFLKFGQGKYGLTGHERKESQTKKSGGGMPHNNMPPYIALTFCKKAG